MPAPDSRECRLTPIRYVRTTASRRAVWLYRCACGTEMEILKKNVRCGNTKSCGCLRREALAAPHKAWKEREPRAPRDVAEYHIWCSMKQRCSNPRTPQYQDYGGRGIYVCSGWNASYDAFIADMGSRPSAKHSIDRIDNDAGYACGRCQECIERDAKPNCRWATCLEQHANKRSNRFVMLDGERVTATEAARRSGLRLPTVLYRMNSGRSDEEIVFPGRLPRRAAQSIHQEAR